MSIRSVELAVLSEGEPTARRVTAGADDQVTAIIGRGSSVFDTCVDVGSMLPRHISAV
jgi:hypothetical protein